MTNHIGGTGDVEPDWSARRPGGDHGVLRVLGLAGSLRAGSYNRMLLDSAVELAPPRMEIEVFEGLAEIPSYNADVAEQGDPPSVASLKESISGAQALLVASPEYNFGIPGVLKNALDWASTPPGQSVLGGRTAALLGASPGMLGTARCQLQLRELFIFTETYVVLQPEVLVSRAGRRFDDAGHLIDDVARTLVRRLLENLEDLTRRLLPVAEQPTEW